MKLTSQHTHTKVQQIEARFKIMTNMQKEYKLGYAPTKKLSILSIIPISDRTAAFSLQFNDHVNFNIIQTKYN